MNRENVRIGRLIVIALILWIAGIVLGASIVNGLIPNLARIPASEPPVTDCIFDAALDSSIGLSPDGTQAIFKQGDCFYLYDIASDGTLSETLTHRVDGYGSMYGDQDVVDWLAWNKQIAYLELDTISLLNTATAEETTYPIDTPERLTAIDFSPDGQWLAVGGFDSTNQGLLTLFDTATQTTALNAKPVFGHNERIAVLQWRPDHREVAISSYDRPLLVVVTTSGLRIAELNLSSITLIVSWSPNGEMLALSTADQILIWTLATDQARSVIEGTRGYDVTWSPDGTQIAWSTQQGEVFVWSLTDQIPKRVLDNFNQSPIESIVWTPDGIIALSTDRTVYLWSEH